MLARMPPYLVELDGTLKEWAWPTLQERVRRPARVPSLRGWPGDEIDPARTPHLARAAEIACRKRSPTYGHGRRRRDVARVRQVHRALVVARLKDDVLVDAELRQLLEQGYVGRLALFTRAHGEPVPDVHGGLLAIVTKMLLYWSGVIGKRFRRFPTT